MSFAPSEFSARAKSMCFAPSEFSERAKSMCFARCAFSALSAANPCLTRRRERIHAANPCLTRRRGRIRAANPCLTLRWGRIRAVNPCLTLWRERIHAANPLNPHHPTLTGDSWAGGLEKGNPFSWICHEKNTSLALVSCASPDETDPRTPCPPFDAVPRPLRCEKPGLGYRNLRRDRCSGRR